MLQKIIEFSLRERLVVYFSVLLIAAAGFYAFTQLPIEAYPDLTNTRVQVISQWPGRSAEELEKFVTIPIETEMNGIPHLINLRSVSLFGLSVVTLTFDDNTEDFYARTKVSEKLQIPTLPDGVNPQLSPESGPTGEIFRYILTGNGVSVMELKTIEDWVLERQVKSVPGVAEVVSFGGPTKQYVVEVDPQKLAYYGLTLNQVIEAVRSNNANAGGSIIERGDQGFVFRGVGLLSDMTDISGTVVAVNQGTPIKVGQVAKVQIGNAVRLGRVGSGYDGDIVEGIVLLRRGENPSVVLEQLKEKANELNAHILPKNVKIVPYYDRDQLISVTTHTVLHNLILGMLLVIVILFVFLGNVRTALIATLVVPLSLLIAFIFMWLRGMSANLLSLGAVDFGVIIDGAVIMVEGMFARLAHEKIMDEGKRIAALQETGFEMSKPIFFSIVIIIATMIPIFSFERIEGRMFAPLAFTLGFALFGSLILSLTFIPAAVVKFLRGDLKEKSPIVEYLHRIYDRVLDYSLRHDKKVFAIALILLVASLYSARFLGTEFLPHLNEGSLWVRATLPMSVSPTRADSVTAAIRSTLLQFDEVKNVVSQLGRPDDGTDAAGFYNSEFYVDLKPKEDWIRHSDKSVLIDDMSSALNTMQGIDFNFSQPISDNVEEAVTGVKGELAVKVFGDDLSVLEKKAQEIREVLESTEGIKDVGIFREMGQPTLQVRIDRTKAAHYGVNVNDVQTLIEASIGGVISTQLYEGEKHFDVVVRVARQFRDSPDKIGGLPVFGSNGQKIPLSLVSDISYKPGAAFIYRETNSRFIAVKFSVRDRDLGGAVSEAQRNVQQKVKLPSGYYTVWGGEFESQQRAMRRLAVVVPLSILIILVLLYSMFDSWTYALLSLLNIPFVTIGGILGLLIARLHFSVSAGIGFIALYGVSVMNGVVLLAYVKKHRPEFADISKLLKFTGTQRVRPIIMVALLAMIGLMPAALSTGIGSETQKPLAVVVVSGLVFTVATNLILLPVIYKMLKPKV